LDIIQEKNFVNADRQTLLQRINIRRVAKPVDLSVVCIAMWMKTMSLHELQQVSNVKEEDDWSEDRTLRYSTPNNTANDVNRDAAVQMYCVLLSKKVCCKVTCVKTFSAKL